MPPGTRLPTQWGILYAARQTDDLVFSQVDGGEGNTAVLLRGAAQIPLTSGQEAGYLVITMTRADFHQLLDGKYGSRNDLLLLNRYWRPVYSSKTSLAASVAPQLRQQLLDGEPLRLEGEEYAYRAAVQEEMGLYAVLQHPQAMNQSTRGAFDHRHRQQCPGVCGDVHFDVSAAESADVPAHPAAPQRHQ